MDTYLVSSAGLQNALDQSVILEPFKNIEVGDGIFAVIHDRHLLTFSRIASDRRFDRAFVMRNHAVDERRVLSRYTFIDELFDKIPVGDIMLRDHQKSARILIDAVDDARTQFAVDAGQFIQLMHQSVYERTAVVAGRRLDDYPFRFVYDRNIQIFMDDIKIQVLRLDVRFYELTLFDDDLVIRLQFIIRLDRSAVHCDDAVFDPALHVASGCIRHDFT